MAHSHPQILQSANAIQANPGLLNNLSANCPFKVRLAYASAAAVLYPGEANYELDPVKTTSISALVISSGGNRIPVL
jgi:hypothetical protein